MSRWDNLRAEWAGRQMRFVPAERHLGGQTGRTARTVRAEARYVVVLITDGARPPRFLLAEIAGRGYCVPSGRIEAGELPEEAARREAYEEAGAIVGRLERLGYYRLQPCSPNEPDECIAPVFLTQLERLEPLPDGSESRGVRWATLDELPALYYQWSPLLEAVFRYACERNRETGSERQD